MTDPSDDIGPPPIFRYPQDREAATEQVMRLREDLDEMLRLHRKIGEALSLLRSVEIHQDIQWHTDDLKDNFYRAVEILGELLE